MGILNNTGRSSRRDEQEKKPVITVKSAERVLDIFELLAEEGDLTFTEIQEHEGIPKGSLHALLTVLEGRGYIIRPNGTSAYCLGPKTFEVGVTYAHALRLSEVVHPPMLEIANRYREVCQFAILDGTDVLYLYKEEPTAIGLTLSTRAGKRLPAYLTALGKAILSVFPDDEVYELLKDTAWQLLAPNSVRNLDDLLKQLAVVRQRGWSVDDEESQIGVMCVGAPVLETPGHTLGAVSMSFVKSQYDALSVERMGAAVLRCADTISAALGFVTSVRSASTS